MFDVKHKRCEHIPTYDIEGLDVARLCVVVGKQAIKINNDREFDNPTPTQTIRRTDFDANRYDGSVDDDHSINLLRKTITRTHSTYFAIND